MRRLKNKRVNNIEFRSVKNLRTKKLYYEIVFWFPNEYYGKESEYVFDGVDSYRKPDNHIIHIHETCFENPESCYTLAIFYKDNEDGYDLKTVGARPAELNDVDKTNFIDIAFEMLNKLNK